MQPCGLLLSYEGRVPDSLCSPLIRCRMQGKRTDYCKVRIEVLNFFPGENSAQLSWNPWVWPPFNIPIVMWWLVSFSMGNTETNISFFRKFKYIIYLSRPFEDDFPVRYMLHYLAAYFGYVWGVRWQCLCAIIRLIISCTFVLKHMKAILVWPKQNLSYHGETFPDGCTKIYYTAFALCNLVSLVKITWWLH